MECKAVGHVHSVVSKQQRHQCRDDNCRKRHKVEETAHIEYPQYFVKQVQDLVVNPPRFEFYLNRSELSIIVLNIRQLLQVTLLA